MKKKTKRVNLTLPADVYKKLSARAKKDRRSIVQTIRVFLGL